MPRPFYLFFLILTSFFSFELRGAPRPHIAKDYERPSHVSAEVWKAVKPYFLPYDHHLRKKLDRIFGSERITLSKETLKQAGFRKVKMRTSNSVAVGRSPALKGYLIKTYLDTQPACEWDNWIKRVTGANSVQACITRHGFKKFRVPKKWIYPLPADPAPPENCGYYRKDFILIVEDMNVLGHSDNYAAYQEKMTPEFLDQLFIILTEEQLIDSVYASNIPFDERGNICFIDLEHHHAGPAIPYHQVLHFISDPMKAHWYQLMEHGGPISN